MIKAILTDIEGTTSSISFVKEVLFPYAARELPAYIRAHANEPGVQAQLQATAEAGGLAPGDTEALIAQLLEWIRQDKKVTPLKALQGMIWKHGYEQGAYRAHVYADAAQRLREWKEQGYQLSVYSSGSIQAQHLFFRYSEAGDLTPLFSHYFDTTTGPKQEVASYRRIASALALPPEEILFLSDIGAELDAAREAGFQTVWLVRPQDSPLQVAKLHTPHRVVADFSQIIPATL